MEYEQIAMQYEKEGTATAQFQELLLMVSGDCIEKAEKVERCKERQSKIHCYGVVIGGIGFVLTFLIICAIGSHTENTLLDWFLGMFLLVSIVLCIGTETVINPDSAPYKWLPEPTFIKNLREAQNRYNESLSKHSAKLSDVTIQHKILTLLRNYEPHDGFIIKKDAPNSINHPTYSEKVEDITNNLKWENYEDALTNLLALKDMKLTEPEDYYQTLDANLTESYKLKQII